jgi:predicted transcriptional regulator
VKRTQIYLDEDMSEQIRAVAEAEGRSAASLIREAVVRYLAERRATDTDDAFLELAGAFAGGPVDGAEEHDRELYRGDSTTDGDGPPGVGPEHA